MAPNKKNIQPEKRQFRLVKFFAAASFVVLIIFSFPLSVVISQQAKDILMHSYENYALLFGQNLNHQVYQNFVIPVTNRFGKIILSEENQYMLMDWLIFLLTVLYASWYNPLPLNQISIIHAKYS